MRNSTWAPIFFLFLLAAVVSPNLVSAEEPILTIVPGTTFLFGQLMTDHNYLLEDRNHVFIVKNTSSETLTLTLSTTNTGGMTMGGGPRRYRDRSFCPRRSFL